MRKRHADAIGALRESLLELEPAIDDPREERSRTRPSERVGSINRRALFARRRGGEITDPELNISRALRNTGRIGGDVKSGAARATRIEQQPDGLVTAPCLRAMALSARTSAGLASTADSAVRKVRFIGGYVPLRAREKSAKSL
jgi:hypothetical protein